MSPGVLILTAVHLCHDDDKNTLSTWNKFHVFAYLHADLPDIANDIVSDNSGIYLGPTSLVTEIPISLAMSII